MAELVAVAFDNEQEADRVLGELARLQKEYLIDLEDAVVAVRPREGKVQPEKVLSELSRFSGCVLRTSLSPEQEARLQAALSGQSSSRSNGAAG